MSNAFEPVKEFTDAFDGIWVAERDIEGSVREYRLDDNYAVLDCYDSIPKYKTTARTKIGIVMAVLAEHLANHNGCILA